MPTEALMQPACSSRARSDPSSSWSCRHPPSCSSAPTEQIVERYGAEATTGLVALEIGVPGGPTRYAKSSSSDHVSLRIALRGRTGCRARR